MTNETDKPSKRRPGDAALGWGIGLLVITVILAIVNINQNDELSGATILIGFVGLVITAVGNAQRSAARK